MIGKNIQMLRKSLGLTQKELADRAGVSSQSVCGWEQGLYEPKGKRLLAVADALGVSVSDLEEIHHSKQRVPVLGVVPAGIPLEAIEDIIGWEDIPSEWAGEYFGLKVRGDSMSPKYLDGDTIIVKAQPTCDSGQDCVVQVNGFDATLKTVHINDGFFTLTPINPAYETLRFKEIKVLGIVVELRRRI